MQDQIEGLTKEIGRVLRVESRVLAGEKIHYRLLEEVPQFFVEIRFREEVCLLPLGERFSDAALTFELFVCGLVTPCSAPYILEDLRDESASCQKIR